MNDKRTRILTITILSILSCLLVTKSYATPFSLAKRISINVSNLPVQAVLKQIESQAQVRFMYNSKILLSKRPVTLNLKNTPVKRILQVIINDPEIVFYDLNQYIVIAVRKEVPKGTQFEEAVVETSPLVTETSRIKYDTITVFDTIAIFDTSHITMPVYDTIKVYDTVMVKQEIQTKNQDKNVSLKKASTSLCLEVMPLYQFMMNNPKDKGQVSFSSQGIIKRDWQHISIGLGVGYFLQRGTTRSSVTSETLDSTLHESSKTEIDSFIVGHYYYIDEKFDTIYITKWDTVVNIVKYKWYNYERKTKTTEKQSVYSITWISVPLMFSWHTNTKKTFNVGISLIVSPSLGINTSGNIYLSSKDSVFSFTKSLLPSYAIFASISPTISYDVKHLAKFYFSPCIKSSIVTIVKGEKYYSLSSGFSVGVSINLGGKRK